MSSGRQSYTVQQKLEAVKYAESHNVSETARAHNVDMEEDFEERDTYEAIIGLSDDEGDSEMLDLNESLLDSD